MLVDIALGMLVELSVESAMKMLVEQFSKASVQRPGQAGGGGGDRRRRWRRRS